MRIGVAIEARLWLRRAKHGLSRTVFMFGGLGIIIYCLVLMGFIGALAVALVFSIIKRSKLGVVASALPLICTLYWLFTDPFNMWGLLTRKPDPADLVAEYQLDGGWSSSYISKMGYKKLSGTITLKSDSTFDAKDIPACCVHGTDETREPFSGGYYSFSGTWKIDKSSAVYIIRLAISKIAGENVPSDTQLNSYSWSRIPGETLELHIMKGKPLSVGFSVFNGDFDDIEFSRK